MAVALAVALSSIPQKSRHPERSRRTCHLARPSNPLTPFNHNPTVAAPYWLSSNPAHTPRVAHSCALFAHEWGTPEAKAPLEPFQPQPPPLLLHLGKPRLQPWPSRAQHEPGFSPWGMLSLTQPQKQNGANPKVRTAALPKTKNLKPALTCPQPLPTPGSEYGHPPGTQHQSPAESAQQPLHKAPHAHAAPSRVQ